VGKGSGLGLSVSLGIVERHGGHIDIRPNERGGVTATVRLPAHRRSEEAVAPGANHRPG
jgi:two-component system, NtrC family, sensor kinase